MAQNGTTQSRTTQISAYLHFEGNCRQAMTFYNSLLGGDLEMQTVGDSPMASQMPAEHHDHILHAWLKNGALSLQGSDMSSCGNVNDAAKGNAASLSLDCGSEDEINRVYAALSDGGNITCPLDEQFWGATFGSLTDRFGTNWLLNYDKAQQA